MKLFRLFAAILMPLAAMVMMQSCSSDNNMVSHSDDASSIMTYGIYEYNFSSFDMKDGSIETEIELDDCMPMRPDLGNNNGKNPPHFRKGHAFARVFAAMNLTEEQKASIRELMQAKILCEMEWFKILREARAEIMADAKAAREAVIAKFRNGEITREEANAAMKEINMNTREQLKNLEVNEEVREGIILCNEEFLAAIRDLLTDEQKVIWDNFVQNIKRG